jgi:two-component system KDP operon response regulator KdpE
MNPKKKKILIIDDEPQIRRFLKITFETHGLEPLEAVSGAEGLRMATSHVPELIVLDLGLPDVDGLQVLKKIREWTQVPVVVLSARDEEESIVNALDTGASDYVTKPFSVRELLARIRAAERHGTQTPEEPVFRNRDLEIDFASRVVKKGGKELSLSSTEYSLLTYFARNAGKVLTHRQILTAVWGPNASSQSQYLRVYVSHLRQKLEPDQSKSVVWISTEPGVGYRFHAGEE